MQFLGVGNGFRRRMSVAYAAIVDLDASKADVFDITLTGNIAIDCNSAMDGQPVIFRLKQDGTGGHTASWGTMFRFGTDIPSVTLSTAADKTDIIGALYNETDGKYDIVSYVRGF